MSRASVDFGPAPANKSLCPSGTFRFSGSPTLYNSSTRISVTKVVDVDFDHDGALESVALITGAVQGADYVVLAPFTSPVANDAAISADAAQQFAQLTDGVSITEEQPGIRILEDPKSDNNHTGGRIKLAS